MARKERPERVVPISLAAYFHESITRKEGIKRLAMTTPDPKKRAGLIKDIPERTEHFLVFEDRVFREYAYSGKGTAALVMLLPLSRQGDVFSVFVPVISPDEFCDGSPRYINGIDTLNFSNRSGRLVLNDRVVPGFTFKRKPITLPLDVSFAVPGRQQHNFDCCGACHWVHAKLHISRLNRFCCLGCC